MQRSRLKNIVNKSKELSKPIGSAFEQFKKSLPKEMQIGDNYRLEVAWKFYGSPKDYKHALWEGLIQPINETDFRLPSIGYNEETDEYEYLNKGKENETVDKDIRVWDNDVIPLVKELKLGGYVRLFNEEKDCWTYTKNIQKETSVGQEGNSVGQEPNQQDVEYLKNGGQMSVIPEGALHARKNGMELAKDGEVTGKGIPVVDNSGEQQAEIEREEIIFSKDITEKIEKLYKKFNEEDSSSKKDDIAIEMGKILTCEIIKNTDDKTGLIEKLQSDV